MEVNSVECLWLELRIKSRHLRFGTFYRPPTCSCSAAVLDNTNTSISLAVDTGIKNISVTGDFNLDMNKAVFSNSACHKSYVTRRISLKIPNLLLTST